MVLFGEVGMTAAGMVGIVGLTVFWSVLAARREASAGQTTGADSAALGAEGVWPPPPRRSAVERKTCHDIV